MSVPENQDPGASPGLFSNLRAFWGVLVAILYTRLDLVSVELEESATYAVKLIILSLAAVLVFIMTIFFLLFFLVVAFWDERVIILSIVSAICVLTTIILGLVARRMVLDRPKFFSQTLTELRRDIDGLRPAPPVTKPGEVKP